MRDRHRLEASAIERALDELAGWSVTASGNAIVKALEFDSFAQAFAFMTHVAMLAERHDHHPDWSNSYRRVRIELTSHDVGGLTNRDFDMARAIERLLVTRYP